MSLNRLFPRRVRRAALALCAAAVLSACGGGDRAEPFTPGRIYAFGDELSVLDNTTVPGETLKYSVNGFNSTDTTTPDCAVNPIWIQTLANSFGMGFAQCPGAYSGKLTAVTRAQSDARVAQLQAQVDTYLASDRPVENDLVTMLAGSHDVLDAYEAWKAGLSRDAAIAQVKAAAEVLAAQVNRVVQAGPAVLVASIPYLGASPYAFSEDAIASGRRQMLLDLTQAFNDALVSGGQGEGASRGLASYGLTGKDYGLIQTGTSWIKNIAESSNGDVRAYNATPMCSVALPNCTTNTLNSGADVNNWVWADTTRPGYAFHSQLGSRAATLSGSRGLPF